MSDALHHLVICADIERSGSLGDTARPAVRESLHALFVNTLAGAGVGPQLYHKEDRGDGVLILVESSVPMAPLLGRWLIDLNEQLREANRDRNHPIRLRVGLHCGLARRDEQGYSGKAVDLTFRLTDSDVARGALAAAPDATLAVIVSERIFTDVVSEGGEYIEPSLYQRVRVTGRSVDTDAWVYIPRLGVPSVSVGGTDTGGTRDERAAAPEKSAAAPAAQQEPDERRVIKTEVYNKIDRIDRVGVLGVVKNSRVGTADDE